MVDLSLKLKLLSLSTSLIFVVLILSLVKKKILKENFAIYWILFTIIIFTISLNFNFIKYVSKILGVANPNNTVFFFAIFFLVFIVIVLSNEVSLLNVRTKNLIQEISILKHKIKNDIKRKQK